MPAALELLGHVNTRATAGLSTAEINTLHDLLRRVLANLTTLADDRGQAVPDDRRRRGSA